VTNKKGELSPGVGFIIPDVGGCWHCRRRKSKEEQTKEPQEAQAPYHHLSNNFVKCGPCVPFCAFHVWRMWKKV